MLEIQYNKNDSRCYVFPHENIVFSDGEKKYKSCGYTSDPPHDMLFTVSCNLNGTL